MGIVEGLTEFLPVSSTAHLRITEALMRIPLDDAYWKMYTVVIQAGAIFALLLLYLQRIVGFLHSYPRGESGDRNWLNHPLSMTIFAFVCTSIPALLLKKWSDRNLGSLTVIALALLIGGIVMWVDRCMGQPLRADHKSRGGNGSRPGHLDRPLPIALRCLPRRLAVHVDHCIRTGGWSEPAFGA